MNTHTENEMVIRATLGEPERWNGNLPEAGVTDPETDAVARMLRKRRNEASPSVLASLTGLTRRDINKHLGRLQRAGRATPVGNGAWVAV